MNTHITLVDINKLIAHEQTDPVRLQTVRARMCAQQVIRKPVIVDRTSHVILDGHHRVRVLQELGAKRVPVLYVRYKDAGIRVYLRRKEMLPGILKRYVVEMAVSRKLFPSKTTRHVVAGGRIMRVIRIKELLE